ncbi:DUF599 domain-containing protein [Rhizobium sp. L1K21]|uniref:DUF599 domain-containing protein n=1 Tax=Rhizobium sp. L1K21 TaxID=2954933 RepID=UPI002092D317|nr:DUF599 family protein [Rhizobium sp. L1K21]MCO6186123.1 DUF599 family protein [Rhizobium sp. L1K21]
MTNLDIFALVIFLALWLGFSLLTDGRRKLPRPSLTSLVNTYRANWIRNSLTRDLKMIDTQIISGLQNGTAFFASTSIFALGGCFALLGAADQAQKIYDDLPLIADAGRAIFEVKAGGLACIFGYSFFKFGWSYRLFNYCSIVFGSIPMTAGANASPETSHQLVERAIRLNILAGRHFNAGLRAIFLSIGYLGWFVGPYVFMLATVFVMVVLIRRQFFSEAREALL